AGVPAAGLHHATDVERVIQLDDVRSMARRQPATIGHAQELQRIAARGSDGHRQGDAGFHQVADRGVQRYDAPRQAPVRDEAAGAVAYLDLEVANPHSSLTGAGQADGVADQDQPPGRFGAQDDRPYGA